MTLHYQLHEYINNKSTTFPFYYGMSIQPITTMRKLQHVDGYLLPVRVVSVNYSHTLNQLHVSLT